MQLPHKSDVQIISDKVCKVPGTYMMLNRYYLLPSLNTWLNLWEADSGPSLWCDSPSNGIVQKAGPFGPPNPRRL